MECIFVYVYINDVFAVGIKKCRASGKVSTRVQLVRDARVCLYVQIYLYRNINAYMRVLYGFYGLVKFRIVYIWEKDFQTTPQICERS